MNPAWYLASLFVNVLLLSVIAGLTAKALKIKIEDNQAIGAFFIFALPAMLEVFSFFVYNRPFLLNFAP